MIPENLENRILGKCMDCEADIKRQSYYCGTCLCKRETKNRKKHSQRAHRRYVAMKKLKEAAKTK